MMHGQKNIKILKFK